MREGAATAAPFFLPVLAADISFRATPFSTVTLGLDPRVDWPLVGIRTLAVGARVKPEHDDGAGAVDR